MVVIDRYAKPKADAAANDQLSALWAEFDRELAYLREPGAGAKLLRAFNATPQEIADAANAAALRQKR